MAVAAVVTLAVTDPGDRADAILACLKQKFGDVDEVDLREYQVTLMGADITIDLAVERVRDALQACDPGWPASIAVSAPPGPG